MKLKLNKVCILLYITLFFVYYPLQTEDNPLFKPLKSIESNVKALLELEPSNNDFVAVTFGQSLQINNKEIPKKYLEDLGVQAAIVNFTEYCIKAENNLLSLGSGFIPPLVHFIWLGSPVNEEVQLVIDSWKKHNPYWKIKVWDEKDVENFEWSNPHSKLCYDNGVNWSEKANILRYEILYQYGGIYADIDMVCLKSFDSLISSDGISFFAGFENNEINSNYGRPLIGSAVFGAEPHSPILKYCIDHCKTSKEAPDDPQTIRSGPGILSDGCYDALLNIENKDVIIFPCSYFYPLYWRERLTSAEDLLKVIKPESFSVHLWEGTWFDFFLPTKKRNV